MLNTLAQDIKDCNWGDLITKMNINGKEITEVHELVQLYRDNPNLDIPSEMGPGQRENIEKWLRRYKYIQALSVMREDFEATQEARRALGKESFQDQLQDQKGTEV